MTHRFSIGDRVQSKLYEGRDFIVTGTTFGLRSGLPRYNLDKVTPQGHVGFAGMLYDHQLELVYRELPYDPAQQGERDDDI
jgi:hypothetical protein